MGENHLPLVTQGSVAIFLTAKGPDYTGINIGNLAPMKKIFWFTVTCCLGRERVAELSISFVVLPTIPFGDVLFIASLKAT